MSDRKWSVTVEVDGEFVLAISSDDLCGVPNVDDFREQILDAARNLIAFIGTGKEEFVTPGSGLLFQGRYNSGREAGDQV